MIDWLIAKQIARRKAITTVRRNHLTSTANRQRRLQRTSLSCTHSQEPLPSGQTKHNRYRRSLPSTSVPCGASRLRPVKHSWRRSPSLQPSYSESTESTPDQRCRVTSWSGPLQFRSI
jgi:hypothetical protein